MRLFIFTRHAHSTYNLEGRVNGDPTVPIPITEQGRAEATRLGHQLAQLPIDLCVHTRFARTTETADEILRGRTVPYVEEPLLDDIDVGDLEGRPLDDYRSWKRWHTRADSFPNGESLDAAAARYAHAFSRLFERTEATILVVCHEIPIRYALNAAAGSDDLDGPEHSIPNATPYLFDEKSLDRAARRVKELSGE